MYSRMKQGICWDPSQEKLLCLHYFKNISHFCLTIAVHSTCPPHLTGWYTVWASEWSAKWEWHTCRGYNLFHLRDIWFCNPTPIIPWRGLFCFRPLNSILLWYHCPLGGKCVHTAIVRKRPGNRDIICDHFWFRSTTQTGRMQMFALLIDKRLHVMI